MAQKQPNLPKLAETELQRFCDLHDVIRNKAYDDQTGWDYLLEFSGKTVAGLAHDHQPGNVTARVQVKSTKRGKAQTRLKLTNALHFTREPDICFVVLFQYKPDGRSNRIFARHFDPALMEVSLRAAREADRKGRDDLHRIFVSIPFTDADDHSDDLMEWMGAFCQNVPSDYATQKRAVEKRLGYETMGAQTTFTFDLEHLQAFIDSTVGLEASVPVKHALIEDVRFGIPGRQPIFEGGGSIVNVKIDPRPARLLIEASDGQSIAFAGDFRLAPPVGSREMMRATFICPYIQLVVKGQNELDLTFSFQPDQLYTIAEIDNICRFQEATRSGATLRLEVEGTTVSTASCQPQNTPAGQRLERVGLIAKTLTTCFPAAHDERLNINQIASAWDEASWFLEMLNDGDMGLRFTPAESEAPIGQIRNYVGYTDTTIGELYFWSIIRRPCLEQSFQDGTWTFKFGDPIVLEGGTLATPDALESAALDEQVRRWVTRLGNGTITLNDGNPNPATSSEAPLRINIER